MQKLDYQPRMAQLAAAGKLPTEKAARELDYQTPRYVLERVEHYFGGPIPFDPATAPDNPTRAASFCALAAEEVELASAWFSRFKSADLARYLSAPADPFVIKGKDEAPDRHYVWRHFPPERDGLRAQWPSGVYVNPPYGVPMRSWLSKIGAEARAGKEIVALIPINRSETDYWQEEVAGSARLLCWVRKRVSFIRPSTGKVAGGNPYASGVWGFNVDERRFVEAFRTLGRVVRHEPLSPVPPMVRRRTAPARAWRVLPPALPIGATRADRALALRLGAPSEASEF